MKLFRSKSQSPSKESNKEPDDTPSTQQDEPIECPICCEDLSASDHLYPLDCPTPECDTHLCADCLQRLLEAALDDYQAASDGSLQVKVKLQCPTCRGKYQVVMTTHATTTTDSSHTATTADNNGSSPPVTNDASTTTTTKQSILLNSQQVIHSVLTLRKAYDILLLSRDDSSLTSSTLTRKDSFLKHHSWHDIQHSHADYTTYNKSLHRHTRSLDQLKPLESLLQGNSDTDNNTLTSTPPPLTDPTLFMGLEELMTRQEQAFVSQLLVSGDMNQVFQGCLILSGMLHMTLAPREELRRCVNVDTMRKRYPLPPHMPRCVRLNRSGGGIECLQNPKHFVRDKHTKGPTLELQIVRGPAGRVGLRRGDVVSHVEGEWVRDYDHLQTLLADYYYDGDNDGVLMAVNINETVVEELRLEMNA